MRNKLFSATLILFIFFLLSTETSHGQEVASRAEEVIWASETAYFTRIYKGDVAGVMLLTDNLYLGWPQKSEIPLNRDEIERFVKNLAGKSSDCKISIDRKGIQVTGGTAIAHFLLHVNCPDETGKVSKQTARITHTWIKRGNLWRLFGGMSYVTD